MDNSSNPNAPRGIRNNNPGNLKADGSNWQGNTGDDGTFYIFADDTWGLRALATDLANKITKDGLNTIRGIVSKYAPPSENITSAYINSVVADTGIGADAPLSTDQGTLHSLMRAIINHENGDGPSAQYISDADIDQGIGMINDSLKQLFQAGVIAVEADPLPAILLVAVGAVLLFALLGKGGK
jgi:hypothetical protein